MDDQTSTKKYICRLSTIAAMLRCTERRVQQLVKEGVFGRTERGLYDLFEVASSYILHLQNKLDTTGLDERKLRAETEKAEGDAELKRIEIDARRGELWPKDAVIAELASRAAELNAALSDFPEQLAFRFPDQETQDIVRGVAYDFIDEAKANFERTGEFFPGRRAGDRRTAPRGDAPPDKAEEAPERKRVGGQKQSPRRKVEPNAGAVED